MEEVGETTKQWREPMRQIVTIFVLLAMAVGTLLGLTASPARALTALMTPLIFN